MPCCGRVANQNTFTNPLIVGEDVPGDPQQITLTIYFNGYLSGTQLWVRGSHVPSLIGAGYFA